VLVIKFAAHKKAGRSRVCPHKKAGSSLPRGFLTTWEKLCVQMRSALAGAQSAIPKIRFFAALSLLLAL
jgi:hypothetical protein